MRLRTSRTRLVHITAALGLLWAATASQAADNDYGAASYHDQSVTRAAAPITKTAPANDPRPAAINKNAGNTPVPARGMSQAQVRASLGAPIRQRTPVGQPPITRWDYPGLRVYFETNLVIHSVVEGRPKPLDHVTNLERDSR